MLVSCEKVEQFHQCRCCTGNGNVEILVSNYTFDVICNSKLIAISPMKDSEISKTGLKGSVPSMKSW